MTSRIPTRVTLADHPSRKLAVILHADVVGSTTLVRRNETLAHERIQDMFRRFSEAISNHGGIAHEIRGDALVAEFSRASDAVGASLAFQAANSINNEQLSDDIRPMLRIGIAMGEVVVADNTVTGEGVVLAQRLEQLAEPGGVGIQGAAYETIPKRLPFDYESIGERQVKGFDEPVRVYAVTLKPGGVIPEPETPAQLEAVALDLPEKPSIAVLPFTNMSSDSEQEYFSDGISEDIITALSKVSSLRVVARTSTFTYKGKDVDIKQVARDQGVRYVLEGSVRKAMNRVRVTAQLIDATTGHHIWAERYDRELNNVFAVQDELMREIVVALDVELRDGEQARMWSSGTKNVEAWECVRLAAPIITRSGVERDLLQGRKLLERAIELDPNYAMAWVMFGWFYQNYADVAGGENDAVKRQTALTSMLECTQKAIEIDPSCADAYSVMALYHMERKEFEKAIASAEKSIELAPSNADNLGEAAMVMIKSGKPHRGLELVRRRMRVCPLYPAAALRSLAAAYRFTGDGELAVDTFRESLKRESGYLSPHVNLSSVLGELGRIDEAKEAAREVLRLAPDFSISKYMQGLSYRKPEDLLRVENGLRRAGLPD